jgi:hypothetical protein
MYARSLIVLLTLAIAAPAAAGGMAPEEARLFVAGKQFSYTCFEGTRGMGRIYPDGSVAGTIQVGGTGPIKFVTLPSGTVRVTNTSVCAFVRGLYFQPCFDVAQTSSTSFRGSISGFSFAYCDFRRPQLRPQRANAPMVLRPVQSAVTLRRSQD